MFTTSIIYVQSKDYDLSPEQDTNVMANIRSIVNQSCRNRQRESLFDKMSSAVTIMLKRNSQFNSS